MSSNLNTETDNASCLDELEIIDHISRPILDHMLNGVAYCKMIYSSGQPLDFIYLYTNPAFEKLTGLKDVIGKPISKVIPHIHETDPGLLDIYNRVAMGEEPQTFEIYVESMAMWFSISVYSPKYGYFVAIFDVITERKKIEETIVNSEKEVRLLAEAMPQIVWVTRADGSNIYFNRQWTEYTGMTLEDSYGHGWNIPFHPIDRQRAWDAWQNAVNNNSAYNVECRLRRADGVYRWWLIRAVPVFDEAGKIYKWFGTCTDIHDIKMVEKELRESRGLLSSIIDSTPSIIFAFDLQQRFTLLNEAMAKFLGVAKEKILGKTLGDFFPKETADKLMAANSHILTTGESLFFEETLMTRFGNEARIMMTSKFPLLDAQGMIVGLGGVATDITDSQKTLVEVSRLLSRQQAILDGANYSIIATDYNGLITDFNAAAERMLGYSAAEMIGKQTPEVFHSKEEVVKHAEKLSQELGYPVKPGFDVFVAKAKLGAVEECEWTYICKDGAHIPVLLSVTGIFDEEKQIVGFMGIASDITERKKSEEALLIAATTFETHEAIMITTVEGTILRVNRAFESITGYSEEDVIGKNPRILSSGRHEKAFYADLWQSLQAKGSWQGEMWDRHKSGNIYPKRLTITAVKTAKGETAQYVAMFADISKRKKAEEEIYNLAFNDPLTGLPNRRLLLDRLSVALLASDRSRHYGGLLFLDLDNFKTLNDTFGHQHGDLLLVEVANRLKNCVREDDTVARLGGDEFVVLLENISEHKEDALKNVAQIAEKIRAALAVTYQLKDSSHHSSPSIGVCLIYGNNESADELLRRADLAMYQAKGAGRNKVLFFDPQMQQAVEVRAALESDLRKAIDDQQLQLYYQVQIDQDLRPFGAEALIRWNHPKRGMVSPAQFIPVAEESSLILEIGHWVLDAACQQLANWSRQESTRDLVLAVNVSAGQFKQPDFVEQVKAAVEGYGVEPSRLKLELTESVALDNLDLVVAKMLALKEVLGVRLSLDDFGTGYSSLAYLKRLPLDQIKIDQSFVRDMTTDSSDLVMVKTIINLAQNFGLNVIAEGVETDEQLALLMAYGCMEFQGYFFSKPVALKEFEALLEKSGFCSR